MTIQFREGMEVIVERGANQGCWDDRFDWPLRGDIFIVIGGTHCREEDQECFARREGWGDYKVCKGKSLRVRPIEGTKAYKVWGHRFPFDLCPCRCKPRLLQGRPTPFKAGALHPNKIQYGNSRGGVH